MVRTPHAHACVLGGTGKSRGMRVCIVVPLLINDNRRDQLLSMGLAMFTAIHVNDIIP